MKFKEGVDITGITKECIIGIVRAQDAFDVSARDLVVTSVCDGNHMKGSKHYEGNAFDVRTWESRGVQMSQTDKKDLANELWFQLGKDYDVVVEATHIHIEYDPS